MQIVENEISKKFIQDKFNELVNYDLPVTSMRNIDAFMDNGIQLIVDELTARLKTARKELLTKMDKQFTDDITTINQLRTRMQDYEQDLDAIEKLKVFKRKSKILS